MHLTFSADFERMRTSQTRNFRALRASLRPPSLVTILSLLMRSSQGWRRNQTSARKTECCATVSCSSGGSTVILLRTNKNQVCLLIICIDNCAAAGGGTVNACAINTSAVASIAAAPAAALIHALLNPQPPLKIEVLPFCSANKKNNDKRDSEVWNLLWSYVSPEPALSILLVLPVS